MRSLFRLAGRPFFPDEEVGRIAERFKSNGADVDARIAPPAKSGAKAEAAAKGKRIARKRRSIDVFAPQDAGVSLLLD